MELLQPAIAVLISLFISVRAYKKKSLDFTGALSGFLVFVLHLALNIRFGAILLVFFLTSSKLTKVGKEKKGLIDEHYREGGQRNWIQVLCNSGIACVLTMAIWILTNGEERCLNNEESVTVTCLIGAFIGHYSCCIGDTWSSELGVLSDSRPYLITTFKQVQKGTNGAVTIEGLVAAAAGGAVIGTTFVCVGFLTTNCSSDVAMKQFLAIPLSTLAGLGGSLIDSFLGATLQYSGFCSMRKKVVSKPGPTVKRISGSSILDNNMVNLVSISITTVLTGLTSMYI